MKNLNNIRQMYSPGIYDNEVFHTSHASPIKTKRVTPIKYTYVITEDSLFSIVTENGDRIIIE